MKYRREIDGLRTIAVVPVILFHAGLSVFGGGYVGVDVFFVISGFLITRLIVEELDAGTFTILKFYERRARRILPALAVVMLACIPFAWIWMLPLQFTEFVNSLIAVSLFASNMLFWKESGYFDSVADEKPLLHTWSLAVEEQYYLLFPIMLLLFWRFGRKNTFIVVGAIAIASLALSEVASRISPSANFYWLPTRAWELLMGSLCAYVMISRKTAPRNDLSVIGLALIIVSIFAFDSETRFPSLYALAPTVGAALVLLFAQSGTFVASLLSTRIFVGIGLISYSVYLWHQPLFAFARIRLLEEPPQGVMATLAVAAFGLGYLSWRFVERPFRTQRDGPLFDRRGVFQGAGLAAVFFIGFGFYGHLSEAATWRINIAPNILKDIQLDPHKSCFDFSVGDVDDPNDWFCEFGADTLDKEVTVVGDSHSLSYLAPLVEELNSTGYKVRYAGNAGCPPFKDTYVSRKDRRRLDCNGRNHSIFRTSVLAETDAVILIGRWTFYGFGDITGRTMYLGETEQVPEDEENSYRVFKAHLGRTITYLNQNDIPVIVLHQPPVQKYDAKDVYSRAVLVSNAVNATLANMSLPMAEHTANYGVLRSEVEAIVAAHADLTRSIDPATVLCSQRCVIGRQDVSYYRDDDHLSNRGAALIVPQIVEAVEMLTSVR